RRRAAGGGHLGHHAGRGQPSPRGSGRRTRPPPAAVATIGAITYTCGVLSLAALGDRGELQVQDLRPTPRGDDDVGAAAV
ncbi:MAG TPA: hypothetical protein VI094_21795, partial [Propionibacteriaceae bacterium]